VLELLPGKLMSRDNLASMELDSVCDCDCDFPAVLGSNRPRWKLSRRTI